MIVGIDIGGTKIAGVLFDGKKVIRELTIVTPNNLFEFKRSVLKLVDFLSADYGVTGVGIGMAGLVNSADGKIIHSPNIRFAKNLDLIKLFRDKKFKKIKIDNDANCFARAELLAGQGKKFSNFLVLTLGTGIGGGIVINRQLYRGQNNSGGEFGHVVMGDVFFEKKFQQLRNRKDFKGAGKEIGKALVSFINIFAPEAIIIGGGYGVSESKKYLPTALEEVRMRLFNQKAKTKILISKLNNAGAVGAALLVT